MTDINARFWGAQIVSVTINGTETPIVDVHVTAGDWVMVTGTSDGAQLEVLADDGVTVVPIPLP